MQRFDSFISGEKTTFLPLKTLFTPQNPNSCTCMFRKLFWFYVHTSGCVLERFGSKSGISKVNPEVYMYVSWVLPVLAELRRLCLGRCCPSSLGRGAHCAHCSRALRALAQLSLPMRATLPASMRRQRWASVRIAHTQMQIRSLKIFPK